MGKRAGLLLHQVYNRRLDLRLVSVAVHAFTHDEPDLGLTRTLSLCDGGFRPVDR